MRSRLHNVFHVVGVGGGWRTPVDLALFLLSNMQDAVINLVDGGLYRSTQVDHEFFLRPGNKAEVSADFLRKMFPTLDIRATPNYVSRTVGNGAIAASSLFESGAFIFGQVDNNKSRKILAERAAQLPDATLICAGVGDDQLRILVHIRRGGKDITSSPLDYCPEIANPTDESPIEKAARGADCLEQATYGSVDHPFTLLASSTFQVNAFYTAWKLDREGRIDEFPYCELWYDIKTGRCRTEKLEPRVA